jgi:hypothetical protein
LFMCLSGCFASSPAQRMPVSAANTAAASLLSPDRPLEASDRCPVRPRSRRCFVSFEILSIGRYFLKSASSASYRAGYRAFAAASHSVPLLSEYITSDSEKSSPVALSA